jgi:hypothetical protein
MGVKFFTVGDLKAALAKVPDNAQVGFLDVDFDDGSLSFELHFGHGFRLIQGPLSKPCFLLVNSAQPSNVDQAVEALESELERQKASE